jgi:hypothetical protein
MTLLMNGAKPRFIPERLQILCRNLYYIRVKLSTGEVTSSGTLWQPYQLQNKLSTYLVIQQKSVHYFKKNVTLQLMQHGKDNYIYTNHPLEATKNAAEKNNRATVVGNGSIATKFYLPRTYSVLHYLH